MYNIYKMTHDNDEDFNTKDFMLYYFIHDGIEMLGTISTLTNLSKYLPDAPPKEEWNLYFIRNNLLGG